MGRMRSTGRLLSVTTSSSPLSSTFRKYSSILAFRALFETVSMEVDYDQGHDHGQTPPHLGMVRSALPVIEGSTVESENPLGFNTIRSPSFPDARSGANQYPLRLAPAACPATPSNTPCAGFSSRLTKCTSSLRSGSR